MVSFSCEVCNDTVIKKKLDQHTQRCHGAYFTCIDCSVTFQGTDYRRHTTCISEAEKYEKALYKGPKKSQVNKQAPNKKAVSTVETKVEITKTTKETAKKVEKTANKGDLNKKAKKTLDKYLKDGKQENFYKIVKKFAKDSSKETKDILKDLKVTRSEDGVVTLIL